MASRVQPLLVGGVDAWLEAFTQPTVLIELGALALCAVLAWALVGLLRRGVRVNVSRSILFGRNVIDGVLFPLALLALAYVARTLLQQWVPLAAFAVAIPVLVSLVVIRIGVKVLQAAFPQAGWVRPIERSISWLAWLVMVLWVTGLLPLVLKELDGIKWKVGSTTLCFCCPCGCPRPSKPGCCALPRAASCRCARRRATPREPC